MMKTKLQLEIFKSDVYQYELAEKLGISKFKLCRLLQAQISKDEEQLILSALRELEQEKAQEPVAL